MNRTYLLNTLLLTACAVFCLAESALGQVVDITLKSKKDGAIKGTIAKESIQGIELQGSKQVIPANDIADVDYEPYIMAKDPLKTKHLKIYRPASGAEKTAWKSVAPDDKARLLVEAAQKYEKGLEDFVKEFPDMKEPHRHFEFKMAYLKGQAALTGAKDREQNTKQAIAELTVFKAKHPNSWQYTPVMLMLGQLAMSKNDLNGARLAYKELASAVGVPESVKIEVEYQTARLFLQENNYAEAQKTFQALIPRLKAGSDLALSARLDEIRCMAAQNQRKAAIAKVQAMQKEIGQDNKAMKAQSFNVLGELYVQEEDWQEARWPFLWVDVIYNQNEKEHAKALYYLNKVFTQLREFDRAEECFQLLINDQRFAASEFRQRALDERKKAG
jgi:tetratricopeptide (TPR) repeat protein